MTKSSTYQATFRRHRRLLCAPIVVSVLIAAFLVLTSPKSYQSKASLWVDSPATTDSSLGNLNPAITPPSTQEQNVVNELLATRAFVVGVSNHSKLGPYLASHHSGGLSSLFGGGGSLNDRILGALGPSQVTTTVPGPQVLQVNYAGPTPAIAQSTLSAMVDELQQDSVQFSEQHNQGALNYYKNQVQSATQALQAARNQADQYRSQHPNASPDDPNLAALATAEGSAGAQLTQANQGLSQASSALQGGASVSQVQVIDRASLPTAPTSGKKTEVEAILGGLVAGALISFLGTVALTRRESDPWEDELAESQGNGGPPQAGGAPVWTTPPAPHHLAAAAGGGGAPRPAPAAPAGVGAAAGSGPGGNGTVAPQRLFVSGRRFAQPPPGADQS